MARGPSDVAIVERASGVSDSKNPGLLRMRRRASRRDGAGTSSAPVNRASRDRNPLAFFRSTGGSIV